MQALDRVEKVVAAGWVFDAFTTPAEYVIAYECLVEVIWNYYVRQLRACAC